MDRTNRIHIAAQGTSVPLFGPRPVSGWPCLGPFDAWPLVFSPWGLHLVGQRDADGILSPPSCESPGVHSIPVVLPYPRVGLWEGTSGEKKLPVSPGQSLHGAAA
jgi:hypothetical protein